MRAIFRSESIGTYPLKHWYRVVEYLKQWATTRQQNN
jgi:hypothetical protein